MNPEETNKQIQKALINYKNDRHNVWNDSNVGFIEAMDKLGKAVNDLTADYGK